MKRLISLCSAFLLLFCFCLPVSAADGDGIPYICDTVPLLSEEEWTDFEEQAAGLSSQYQCAVYFVTVDDYTDYGSGSVYDVAKTIYTKNDLGWGDSKSGILLLLSMEDRDYALIAYGYGNTVLTDYGSEYMSNRFLDDFAEDDWASGCSDYLDTCSTFLKMAGEGKPFDVGSQTSKGMVFLVSLVLGAAVGYLICRTWRFQARQAVHEAANAEGYLQADGLNITSRSDCYTHTTRISRKIASSSSKSGGTTVDSSGFSGRSGKF